MRVRVLVAAFGSARPASQSASSARWIRVDTASTRVGGTPPRFSALQGPLLVAAVLAGAGVFAGVAGGAPARRAIQQGGERCQRPGRSRGERAVPPAWHYRTDV